MDCSYIVTVSDVGNITNEPDNIHTILTSTDNIQPRERVMVHRKAEPVSFKSALHNPSMTIELEAHIRKSVREIEESECVHIIAMLPVKAYVSERLWAWDGYVLIESNGDHRYFDMDGMCNRVSSAYEVPR